MAQQAVRRMKGTGPRRQAGRTRIPIGPFGFRSGSLPDRLLRWARARGRPFRIPEVAETLDVGRVHAYRLVGSTGTRLRRLGYGVRVEARVYDRATPDVRRAWRRAANAEPVSFRPGSLLDRFARWTAARTAPFRPRDAARALDVTLQHALRMMQRSRAKGLVEPLTWGTYVGPGVRRSGIYAWREERRRHPFRAGSARDRVLRWATRRTKPFGIKDAMNALGVAYHCAWDAIRSAVLRGRMRRLGPGSYAVAGKRPARRGGRAM